MENSKYRCPHCGSDNTRSFSIIYSEGHGTGVEIHREIVGHNVQSKVTTYADGHKESKVVGSTPVYGNVSNTNSYTSDLAQSVAPPSPPTITPDKVSGAGSENIGELIGGIGCLAPIIAFLVWLIVSFANTFGFINVADFWDTSWHGAFEFMKIVAEAVSVLIVLHCIYDYKNKKIHAEEQRENARQNMEKYRKAKAAWHHSYRCLRCGHSFLVDE